MEMLIALVFDLVARGATVNFTFGMDVDYPPYAFKNDTTGELMGFGKDFADGMTALCPDITIDVVQAAWKDCWDGSTASIGQGLNNGTYDACMTYTHTQGVRNDYCDFSDAILDLNKPVGLIVKLGADGLPKCIDGDDDLAGRTVVDVKGWAPTADTIIHVENKCTGQPYSGDVNVIPNVDGANNNDEALKMVLDETADAMFVYADQAYHYKLDCEVDANRDWTCDIWTKFGVDFAYVQTGQYNYSVNGTTIAMTKKGSGVAEAINPCLAQFLATEEYYTICAKHDLVSACYPNQYFPASNATIKPYMQPTTEHSSGCSDGYCPCTHNATGTCAEAVFMSSATHAIMLPMMLVALLVTSL